MLCLRSQISTEHYANVVTVKTDYTRTCAKSVLAVCEWQMGRELLASERLEERPVWTDVLGRMVGKKPKNTKYSNQDSSAVAELVQILHLIGKQWCVHVRLTT